MKKICFVTATRAEYGLLKWLMRDVADCREFELQLVVTGAHLMKEQGHTVDVIRDDGFKINEEINVGLDTGSTESIADSMGRMAQEFSHAFARLLPDYVVVLGDRYELLPIVNTAFVMGIPVIHLCGGYVTEGAIDDGVRNAVTMLSDYHFPGTRDSADNIIRMRGSDKNVWVVGEPGLDSFVREELMARENLAGSLDLDANKDWVLFTYHPETRQSRDHDLATVKECISLLLERDNSQIVATYSNADFGGREINEYLDEVCRDNRDKLRVLPSLGNRRYLSFMKQVVFVMGNSSSGIVEAPVLGVPVINIGDRQKGRHQCSNILQADPTPEGLRAAVKKAHDMGKCEPDFYWGDGHTAETILGIIKNQLL